MAAGEREHGYARYQLDGCRCYVCGYAKSRYNENRAKAITAGTWQPWVDAEPVRVHVRYLQACQISFRVIAAVAGVDRWWLHKVMTGRPDRGAGPQDKIRPESAAAILAVEPSEENLGGGTVIDATTVVRRLRALVANGWPQHHLAVRLGMTDTNFASLLRRSSVTVRVARAVRVMYRELECADPRSHGVDEQAYNRARNRAAGAQWASAGCWDDDSIDDPAAFPEWTGQCGTRAGYYAHSVHGIPCCRPCRDAKAAGRREQRARKAARAA